VLMVSAKDFPLGSGNRSLCLHRAGRRLTTLTSPHPPTVLLHCLPLRLCFQPSAKAWETQAGFMQAVAYSAPEPDLLGKAVKRHPQSISINQVICWFNIFRIYTIFWKRKLNCLQLIN